MALTLADVAISNRSADDADYEAILSAIMSTARGRRFLTEYARRSRRSDTQMVLNEINKLKCGSFSNDLFDFKSLTSEKHQR